MALQMRFMEKNVFKSLKRLKGGRPLNMKKTRKFLKGIRENNGKLPETCQWPITVNAKSEVLDGQNHWQAVLIWNEKHPKNQIEAIPYFLIPDGNLETAKKLNEGNERWSDRELIASWRDLGYADFSELEKILSTKTAKSVGQTIVYKICGNPDIKNIHKTIVDGSFKMWRNPEDAETMIAQLASVKKQLVKYGDKDLIIPIFLACTRIPNIDMNHFCAQLNAPTVSISYSLSSDDVLKMFTRVYNSGEGSRSYRPYLDIAALYKVVESYNCHQSINQNAAPQLRQNVVEAIERGHEAAKNKIKEAKVKSKSRKKNSSLSASSESVFIPQKKKDELHDNGVVPV